MNDFDDFDFGFTAVNENELEAVVELDGKVGTVSEEAQELRNRLDLLYNSIIPLLNNLKKNPDKEYILWPNRIEKIEEFEERLDRIYKGD